METIRFKGPAAYVSDLDRSRGFYEGLLGFEVGRVMRHADADIAVAYTAGFSIWLVTHAYWSIFGPAASVPPVLGHGNWENTFETPRFDEIYATLRGAGARFAHELREFRGASAAFGSTIPTATSSIFRDARCAGAAADRPGQIEGIDRGPGQPDP